MSHHGRNVEPVAINPPRQPIAYTPTLHFGEKFDDKYDEHDRYLDDDVVRECIENGETYARSELIDDGEFDPTAGPVYFRATVGGVTFRLVIDVDDREVITGFPIGVQPESAIESGRWSRSDVDGIREFLAAKFEGDDDRR